MRNAFQPPALPSGNPAALSEVREAAYSRLFMGEAVRVFPHEVFEKPNCGGRVEVRVYELQYDPEIGRVQAAITSGMSDYRMVPNDGGRPFRREVIQYFRQCRDEDIARLHGVAWLPLASGFALDHFQSIGPIPGEWPASLFLPSLVAEHAEFKLELNGDDMQLLWHVPLRQTEIDFKLKYGVDALLGRMAMVELPWIFDSVSRPPLF